jgi:hypothetical protein
MILKPYDREALRREFQAAVPFPHLVIESFLEPEFAAEAAAAFPSWWRLRQGLEAPR